MSKIQIFYQLKKMHGLNNPQYSKNFNSVQDALKFIESLNLDSNVLWAHMDKC